MFLKAIDTKIRQWNHKRIDFFRYLKLQLVYLLCLPFCRLIKENKFKKFLIIRLDDKLGDSVTSTGFFRELKKNYPDSCVKVITTVNMQNLYKRLDYIDEVIIADKNFLSTFKLIFKLQKDSFDFIINTSHILNPRVVAIVALLSAARKIGFENSDYKIFTDTVTLDFKKDHISTRYTKLLLALGVSSTSLDYEIKLDELAKSKAHAEIFKLRTRYKKIIAFNCFAGGRLRNINESVAKQIVKKLTLIGDVAIVFLANSGDHLILEQWRMASEAHCFKFQQLASLDENMALANEADLVLTPDTAWVHIASGLRKKLVAIYRDDADSAELNSVIWAPYKTEFKMLHAPSTELHLNDINNVSIDEVLNAVEELFKS